MSMSYLAMHPKSDLQPLSHGLNSELKHSGSSLEHAVSDDNACGLA